MDRSHRSVRPPNPSRRSRRPDALISLTPQIRQKIRAEAKALGLAPNQYMRFIVNSAATLRESLAFERKVDGKQLIALIDNPLFGALLRTLVQTIATNRSAGDEATNGSPDTANDTAGTSVHPPGALQAPANLPQGSPTTPVHPPRPNVHPMEFYDFW